MRTPAKWTVPTVSCSSPTCSKVFPAKYPTCPKCGAARPAPEPEPGFPMPGTAAWWAMSSLLEAT